MALKRNRKMRPLRDRFMDKFMPEPNSGCWLWYGAPQGWGYGSIGSGRRGEPTILAHRAAWLLFKGEIPPGAFVLHKCDTPACVNPDHLFLGDHQANVRDMMSKGRSAKGEKNGMSKLSETEVRAIKGSGEKGRVLAKRIGISEQIVSQIRNDWIWKHVT